MKTKQEAIKKTKERFGQYAILGSMGKVYNGAVDDSVRIIDLEQFIEEVWDSAYDQGLTDLVQEQNL